MFSKFVIIALLLLTVFTRFYNLNWGSGYFFHPDENNMAYAISNLSFANLNPHFFAYGQFPLYLVFFTQSLINSITGYDQNPITFSQAIIDLRLFSAFFSCLTIFVFWFISKYFFKQNMYRYLLILLLVFSPGLIQLAHFGTTESLLILIFSLSLFYAIKMTVEKKISNQQIIFCSLFLGIGIASKVIAVIFMSPIFLSIVFLYFENKKNKIFLLNKTLLFILLTLVFSCIFSPYNLISSNEFLSAMAYETGIATGKTEVFYTRQFDNTIPYLFQINKIFPYALGLPVLLLSFIGLFLTKYKKIHLIFLFSFLVYFIYSGQLFVKWFRFTSPLFPILIIFAVLFLQKIKNKFILYLLLLVSIIPGIVSFNQVYLKTDNRITANNWIIKNISQEKHILSEDRNIIQLPFVDTYKTTNFNFYDLDSSLILKQNLVSEISSSDYIIVPSRRVYKNHAQEKYPTTFKYYESLFNGSLGYKNIISFSSSDSLFSDSNNAEETFSVFDHPQILIFKKDRQLSQDQYRQILNL